MIHIFIVNPYAGKENFADELREHLKEIPDLNYFVFSTRYAGHERELVQKVQHIFQDEKLRFYCCGGMGTMRNMLSGFDDLEHAEVAFFPCGLTNDFLKVFGENEKRFYKIEELITGEVITLDYIRTPYGVGLNTFSVGLDSNFQTKMEDYRILGMIHSQIPYTVALLDAIFMSSPQMYELEIDDIKKEGSFAEIFMGNGGILGGNLIFSKTSDVTDGKAMFCVAPGWKGFRLLPLLLTLVKGDIEKLHQMTECGFCNKIKIRRKDGQPFKVNFDGEPEKEVVEWEAVVVKKGLQLIVPKGVRI